MKNNKTVVNQRYHDLIGTSYPMQLIYQTIDQVAQGNAPIIITGETGTGKELCAKAIHQKSQRKDKPFVVLNCAAIPKDLIEDEIFGHLRGAFTGAVSNKLGFAHQANGGTLFLDEIGEMDFTLQCKLLRFVQEHTFHPIGGQKEERVDIRLICATHRDLLAQIKAGQFREDLYYRINVIEIQLPALRQRGQDILLLAQHFLDQYAQPEKKTFHGFSSEVEEIFLSYNWPGNVRQLKNVIHHIVLLNQGQMVTIDMLPSKFLNKINENSTNTSSQLSISTPTLMANNSPKKIRPLWQVEKEAIEQALEYCAGDVQEVANLLEISRSKNL
jgi:two-component system repressor protein LuxO